MAAGLELLDLVGQLGGDLGQAVRVDADAGRLHRAQDGHERQLDALVEVGHLALGQPLGGARVQAAHGSGAAHEPRGLLVGGGLQAQAGLLGHLVDLVRRPAGIEQVGGQGGVAGGRERRVLQAVGDHAVVAQRLDDLGRRSLDHDHLGAVARHRRPAARNGERHLGRAARADRRGCPRATRARPPRAPRPARRAPRPRARPDASGSPAARACGRAPSSSSGRAAPPRARRSRCRSRGRGRSSRAPWSGRRRRLPCAGSRAASRPGRRRGSRRRPPSTRTARGARRPSCRRSRARPGMLSEVSPLRPMKSGTSSGPMP